MAVNQRERLILERVEALLLTITGAEYNYDISLDNALRWGDLDPMPGLEAQVCIWGASEGNQNGVTWGANASVLTLTISGFVQTDADTPRARVLAACDLLSDLKKLVNNNKRLGSGLSRDVRLNLQAFDGQLLYPGYGAIWGTVEVAHSERWAP